MTFLPNSNHSYYFTWIPPRSRQNQWGRVKYSSSDSRPGNSSHSWCFSYKINSCRSSSKLPFTFPMLRWSQTPIWTISDGTIPYLWHRYRINRISTTEDMAISIPSIHQSYVGFTLQTNSISSHQVEWQQPQTTLWHQNWTPSTTLQSFNNPISMLLSTIPWRVRHEGNPTHVANSDEIRCGIQEEDGHYIVDCTKEQ